jgi:hypothetical protein
MAGIIMAATQSDGGMQNGFFGGFSVKVGVDTPKVSGARTATQALCSLRPRACGNEWPFRRLRG